MLRKNSIDISSNKLAKSPPKGMDTSIEGNLKRETESFQ